MKSIHFVLGMFLIQVCNLHALQFEIVPFDSKDQEMKQQLCSMVTNDKQIQHNTFLSDDKEELEMFFRDDKGSKTYLLVAKIKDQQPPIYSGFMKYSIEKKNRGNQDRTYTYGDLETLAIDASYRKQGLATQLITRFEDVCNDKFSLKKWKDVDFEPILEIIVFSSNKEAIALYKKLGYELSDSSKGYKHARKSLVDKN